MSRVNYSQIRSYGLIATMLILIAHNFIPERRLQIHPSSDVFQEIHGYQDPIRGESARFVDRKAYSWACSYLPKHAFGCGWVISWDTDHTRGLNLSNFERAEIYLVYTGTAQRIRVFMRNYDEHYGTPGKVEHSKFMSTSFRVKDGTHPVTIGFDEFSVSNEWLRARNIKRDWVKPEFNNIVQFGFDLIEPGEHQMSVQKITLSGPWVKTRHLLYIIVLFWMSVFMIEGLMRFGYLYRRSKNEKQLIRELRIRQFNLEEEKENLKGLANHDPLTGVLNRTGIQSIIYDLMHTELGTGGFGVLVLDVDQFKNINEKFGHDIGDLTLKNFAAVVSENLRESDHFARWSGEEFIIISLHKTLDGLTLFAEKLRAVVAHSEIPKCPELRFSVSIGATLAKKEDTFDDVFKRADEALHRAKQAGRNRVEFEA